MRTCIAVVPGFGRLYGYEDSYRRCMGRVADAIRNGDLPMVVAVFRLPKRLTIGPIQKPGGKWYEFEYSKIKDRWPK